ncbi:ParA family protein [Thermoleptolyngbya sp. M55_K2018_002]|uniref:ParA family protein n=1 Tax=Thermoleptolyngbya sp. M55_K2018_002 TaxID=2747808 RepID=UPI0019D90514|nr:ParA family protein [Thermoleptolyngbya sp. M55_K2018_002]HIK39567.1 ParA family protein [Thermoleptolyngbya sp. M55_K2018_002]
MIITVASFKGGVGKTTAAIHLAAFLQTQGETLLIDADPNRSATGWAKRGSLPYEVIDEWRSPQRVRNFSHVVIDTQARPVQRDLELLTDGCDLLILPTTPDVLAMDALVLTLECLHTIGANRYRIMLNIIPPKPSRDGETVRSLLQESGMPVFVAGVRRLAAFQKAARAGVPVYDVKDPRAADGWQDYVSVGQEMLEGFGG